MSARAVKDGEHWHVEFEDMTTIIGCDSQAEAEALAEAWRQWPSSSHPPVEAHRNAWRTGFADGAAWQAARAVSSEGGK